MEHHLKQDVAELFTDAVGVARVDGLERLVDLLEEVAGQRPVGLFPVPWAAVGSAEPVHHGHQVEEPGPDDALLQRFLRHAADSRRAIGAS